MVEYGGIEARIVRVCYLLMGDRISSRRNSIIRLLKLAWGRLYAGYGILKEGLAFHPLGLKLSCRKIAWLRSSIVIICCHEVRSSDILVSQVIRARVQLAGLLGRKHVVWNTSVRSCVRTIVTIIAHNLQFLKIADEFKIIVRSVHFAKSLVEFNLFLATIVQHRGSNTGAVVSLNMCNQLTATLTLCSTTRAGEILTFFVDL